MVRTFVVLLIFTPLLWHHVEAKYAAGTSQRIRYKIIKMDLELYKDARSKVNAILHMRKLYSKTSSFRIAAKIYLIRRRYARMIFVYFKTLNGFDKITHHLHLDHLREIHHLAFEIDNLIMSTEEWEDRKTRKKRITRMGGAPEEEDDIDTRVEREKEKRLKQRAYVERKKMLWSLNQGNSRDNLKRSQFQIRDLVEEGFNSDSF